MKKTKWLIPSLLVATAPIISLASCSNVCIEWDSRINPTYTYQSQKLQVDVTSYDDATNKFFENVTPFIICDDAINSVYINFYLVQLPKYILVRAECSKLDKEQHRISMKLYSEYKMPNEFSYGTMEVINLPFRLSHNEWVGSDCWCVGPKGCEPNTSVLPDVLKNDDTWQFIYDVTIGQRHDKHIVNNKSTSEEDISLFVQSAVFATAFMSDIPDPGQSVQ